MCIQIPIIALFLSFGTLQADPIHNKTNKDSVLRSNSLYAEESQHYSNSPFETQTDFVKNQNNLESSQDSNEDYSQSKNNYNKIQSKVPDITYGKPISSQIDYEKQVRSHYDLNSDDDHDNTDYNHQINFPLSSLDKIYYESSKKNEKDNQMLNTYNDHSDSYQMPREFENDANSEDELNKLHSQPLENYDGFIPIVKLKSNSKNKNRDYNFIHKPISEKFHNPSSENSQHYHTDSEENSNYHSNEVSHFQHPEFYKDDFNSDNFEKSFDESSNQDYPSKSSNDFLKQPEHSNHRYPSSSFPSTNFQTFNPFFKSPNFGSQLENKYPVKKNGHTNSFPEPGLYSNPNSFPIRNRHTQFYPTKNTQSFYGSKYHSPSDFNYYPPEFSSSNSYSQGDERNKQSSNGNFLASFEKNPFNLNSLASTFNNDSDFLSYPDFENHGFDLFSLVGDSYIPSVYEFSNYGINNLKGHPYTSSSTLFPITSNYNFQNTDQSPYMPSPKPFPNGIKFLGLGNLLNSGLSSSINQALFASIGSNLGSGLSAKMKDYSSNLYKTLYNSLALKGNSYHGSASKLIPQVIKSPFKKIYKVLIGASHL